MPSETEIMRAVRFALNACDGCRVFRNNVGMFYPKIGEPIKMNGGLYIKVGNPVKVGLGTGTGDLIGWVTSPDGRARFFSVEVKSAKGKSSPEQEAWKNVVNKHGGYACCVRGVDEALEHYQKARIIE